jgi:hypothetical protein
MASEWGWCWEICAVFETGGVYWQEREVNWVRSLRETNGTSDECLYVISLSIPPLY